MKKILILLGFISLGISASAQFPSIDSLRKFMNKWVANSSIDAFTQKRLNTVLNGMIGYLDSAYSVSGASKMDSLVLKNDSVLVSYCCGGTVKRRDTISISSSGSGITSVGSFNPTSDPKGATISGSAITIRGADATNPGILKLYTSTGSSTDGTMDRNSINTALGLKAPLASPLLTGQVGLNGSPNASAALDIQGTTKGVLLPRLTTTQMNAISSPATGLLIFNTDTVAIFKYTGSAWVKAEGSGGAGFTGITNQDLASITGNGSSTPLKVTDALVTSATFFNKGFSFNNFSYAYGTSIFFGLHAESFWNMLNRQIGNNILPNYSVSSTGVRTALYYIAKNVGMNIQGASIGDPAFNYSRWGFATAGFDTTHLFAMLKAGYRALTAWQLIDTVQFYRVSAGTVNPNVSTSGSAVTAIVADSLQEYCSHAQKFGTNIWWKSSITANETVTFGNIKGRNLVVALFADSIGGSRIEIRVDGVLITTYDPNNRCIGSSALDGPTGFHRLGFIPDAVVMTGFGDTLHSVQLKFLDAGKFGGVDYVGNLKEPSRAAFTPIYVPDIQHMTAGGYAITGGSAQVQDSATNSRWADLSSTFPGYTSAIIRVPTNTNFNPSIHTDDGIHPIRSGYEVYTANILSVMNPKAFPENPIASTVSVTAPLHLGGYLTTGSQLDFGDMFFQSYSGSSNMITFNADSYAGATHYVRSDVASAFQMLSNGGITLNTAASGTAGGTISWKYPFYMAPNQTVNVGGDAGLSAPLAYLGTAPSTTSFASFNISNGTAPATPNDGDFWKTSGHLFFRNGGSTVDLLASAGAPAAPLDLGGYITTDFGIRQGDIIIQSFGGTSNMITFNAKSYSSAVHYIRSDVASALQFFSNGGTGIATAASGTAGGTVTFSYPVYSAPNGQIQLGNNVSFSPVSWVDVAASTSSFASLNIGSGSNPSSPQNGDLWYNGTNLNFRHGGTTTDILAGGGGGSGPWNTTGSDIYYNTGKVGIGTATPATLLHVYGNTAGAIQFRTENANAGGSSQFQGVNDLSHVMSVGTTGSTVTPYGGEVADVGFFYTNAAGGMNFMVDRASDITFSAGAGGPAPTILTLAGADGSARFNLYGSGAITGTPLYNAQFTSTGKIIEGQLVVSGTYTPTIANSVNVASSSLNNAFYHRIGNVVYVTVSGSITATAAGGTATLITIDLPFTTSTTSQTNAGSGATSEASTTYQPGIFFVNSGTTGEYRYYSNSTAANSFTITFCYKLN